MPLFRYRRLVLVFIVALLVAHAQPTAANSRQVYSYARLITDLRPAVREVKSATSGLLHPGLGLSKTQLDTMQRHVRRGDEPWAKAFEAFSKVPRSSITPRIAYQPEWTEIPRGHLGQGGNFITVHMAMDGDVAFHQIIMWYVTGNETYRLNAIKVLRDYFSITKIEPHWDSQIRWGISAYKFCFVADLLQHSDGNTEASRWTNQDQARFAHLMEMGKPLITGAGYWMNQHGFATMGLIGTAMVLDDRTLYEQCVERTTVNSGGQQGGCNGSIKWQMRLVTENAATGERVAMPQVQEVEMARDQGHAWLDPTILSLLCQIIENQGTKVDPETGAASTAANAVDVFSFLDDRLLVGTDYITRYSYGQQVTWIPLVMRDGNPPLIGEKINGDPRKGIAGILYNHYKYVKKWDSSNPTFRAIAQAYEAAIPEGDGGTDFPGNSTLFYTPDTMPSPH